MLRWLSHIQAGVLTIRRRYCLSITKQNVNSRSLFFLFFVGSIDILKQWCYEQCKLVSGTYKKHLQPRCSVITKRVKALLCFRDRRRKKGVVPLRWNSARKICDKTRRYLVGISFRHPITVREAYFTNWSIRWPICVTLKYWNMIRNRGTGLIRSYYEKDCCSWSLPCSCQLINQCGNLVFSLKDCLGFVLLSLLSFDYSFFTQRKSAEVVV